MFLVVADENRPHRQRVTCNESIELPDRSARTGKGSGNLAKCRGRSGIKWQYLYPGQERVDRLMDLSRVAIVSSITKLGNSYRAQAEFRAGATGNVGCDITNAAQSVADCVSVEHE